MENVNIPAKRMRNNSLCLKILHAVVTMLFQVPFLSGIKALYVNI